MKIETITLSIFDLPGNTAIFDLVEEEQGAYRRLAADPSTAYTGTTPCAPRPHR